MTIMTTTSHRPFAVFGRTKISDSNPDPTTVWTVYAARPTTPCDPASVVLTLANIARNRAATVVGHETPNPILAGVLVSPGSKRTSALRSLFP
jgi:hypothetical protein